MKNLIFCFILLLSSTGIYAENGAFLILKSTYLYEQNSLKGKRILTRKHVAHKVIDIGTSKKGALIFRIIAKDVQQIFNGSGYILENDKELQDLGEKRVNVYQEIPNKSSDLTDYQSVPSAQLQFTGKNEDSPDFPNLVWREVNYKANLSGKLWVNNWAGIYRSDKKPEWLTQIYEQLQTLQLNKELKDKILMGLVEAGFTKEQVRLTLGIPRKEQTLEGENQVEWTYPHRRIIFKDNLVSRVY